ncbi:MAG: class III signal peptide-containing protein [Elusimicrobia bacterium]|nr:class III signal peptide-containing protein [Elusimicrobiota bacterium]
MRSQKAQSTLEYILLVTAVLVVIIAFVAGPNSPFKEAVNNTLVDAAGQMESMTGKFTH